MEINVLVLFGTALIPLIIGFIWYSKALFGNAWMAASGMTEEKASSGNMFLIFGLTYVLSLLLSFAMMQWGIHQFSTQGLFATQPGFPEGTGEYYEYFQQFLAKYGGLHRTFGHGAVHGIIATIVLALPFIAINALFERKGWRYILIHTGYWLVCLTLMTGLISKFI